MLIRPSNAVSGVSLQDFETTLQSSVDAMHLRGLLNFSVLWNQHSFICDTAMGDNPFVIYSCLGLEKTETFLWASIRAFVEAGAVTCLLRKSVDIGNTQISHPTMAQVYDSWLQRDGGATNRFLTPIHLEQRQRYNNIVDQLFDGQGRPVIWYEPDKAKPRFRSLIKRGIDDGSILRMVQTLPVELQRAYLSVVEKNDWFTTADLWDIVKDFAPGRDLLVAQGYLNQQALADSVGAGIAGADFGHNYQPKSLNPTAETPGDPTTLDELLETADLYIPVPSLHLIGLLSPESVLDLRVQAPFNAPTKDDLGAQVTAYWAKVCDEIARRFPDQAREKRTLYAWLSNSTVYTKAHARLTNTPDWIKTFIEFGGELASDIPTVKPVLVTMCYQETAAMKVTRKFGQRLWAPSRQWSLKARDVDLT